MLNYGELHSIVAATKTRDQDKYRVSRVVEHSTFRVVYGGVAIECGVCAC